MEPRILKTADQYRQARAEVERLVKRDPDPESAEGLRLELFSKLVEDFEKTRFMFARPDPIDAILFRMEQQGLRQKDIAPLLGGKNRASEVLARKRRLTKDMIAALYKRLDIPLELLVREPKAAYAAGRTSSPMSFDSSQVFRSGLLRGFGGFLPLASVRDHLPEIPPACGVYAVVRDGESNPKFTAQSRAGRFKQQDPSYPVADLEKKWVRGTPILYIGKAGPSTRRTLRKRIHELVRFGSGEAVAHRGGRALWQLSGIWSARIAWRTVKDDPLVAERALLDNFRSEFGMLPFANFK